MAVSLGELNLGVVTGISFTDRKRLEDVNIPAMRGSSSQDLGELATDIELTGVFTGASMFDDFKQLQRYKCLGNSLKLDSDVIKTVVFIREAKLAKVTVNTLRYSLTLKQSLFKQVNACDAITGWSSTTPGASVTVASSQPTPLEGLGCIKVSHNAAANQEVNAVYEPLDTFNLEDYDWIAFAWLMDNVTLLSSAVVTITQGTHNATYDFTTLITEAAKWLLLRVHKTQFNNYGALDWGQIGKIKFAVTKSKAQNYFFAVDDVGGFE